MIRSRGWGAGRTGRYRAWLAGAVAGVALAGVAVTVVPDRQPASVAPPAAEVTHRASPQADVPVAAADRQIAALLQQRSEAVRHGDRSAFLATVDPHASPGFRASQRALFDHLRHVRFRQWTYLLDGSAAVPTTRLTGLRGTADAVRAPRVLLRYELAGVDAVPVTHRLGFLFARHGQSWYLRSDTALQRFGVTTWRGPWDFGRVRVITERRGMVLFHPGDDELAGRVAGQLNSAVDAVSAVWGDSWPQRVAVVLPASSDEMSALVGPHFAVDSIAAVAVSDAVDIADHTASGQRVVLNPDGAAELSQRALRVILRHEITHVATRAYTRDGAPLWMLEGFADYVGYGSSGVSLRQAAPDLATFVQRRGPPLRPPGNARFDSGARRLDLSYQEAWSMCAFVAAEYGVDTLVQLYYRVAGAGHSSDQQLAGIVREVTGSDLDTLIAGWQAFLTDRFG